MGDSALGLEVPDEPAVGEDDAPGIGVPAELSLAVALSVSTFAVGFVELVPVFADEEAGVVEPMVTAHGDVLIDPTVATTLT